MQAWKLLAPVNILNVLL